MRPSRSLDACSDIHSLGATLWYALTGAPPKSETDAFEIPARMLDLLREMLAAERSARHFPAAVRDILYTDTALR
jgi:hypothetical protein